ncbi:hypothetical protein OOT55_17090 [Marinimicrobium sp. C6131]|uniref:hypothetical protein n=1 Tax=Marinimicrobium sp. C6131 TaxID=3022676 RepID=UPI00223CCF5A|nr:hypothetical protein [Marinimicrobium sp. C6131]UZJ44353.1 hypothetical protein OOT55_17090 [Marinimicrobium sp. C6131]
MQEFIGQLRHTWKEIMLLVAIAILAPVVVSIDLVVLDNGVGEASLTETVQEALLLLCVLLFGYRAVSVPYARGALILITGFFLCLLLREMDFLFDAVFGHGTWVWPVSAVVLISVVLALLNRNSVFGPAARFLGTRSYVFVLIGFVTLFIFSRLFGSGNLLWKSALGDSYNHAFKSGLQEGLELFAYGLITQGAIIFCRTDWQDAMTNSTWGGVEDS